MKYSGSLKALKTPYLLCNVILDPNKFIFMQQVNFIFALKGNIKTYLGNEQVFLVL